MFCFRQDTGLYNHVGGDLGAKLGNCRIYQGRRNQGCRACAGRDAADHVISLAATLQDLGVDLNCSFSPLTLYNQNRNRCPGSSLSGVLYVPCYFAEKPPPKNARLGLFPAVLSRLSLALSNVSALISPWAYLSNITVDVAQKRLPYVLILFGLDR